MKRLLALTWKELLQLKRDRLNLKLIVGIPVMQLVGSDHPRAGAARRDRGATVGADCVAVALHVRDRRPGRHEVQEDGGVRTYEGDADLALVLDTFDPPAAKIVRDNTATLYRPPVLTPMTI